MSGCTNPRKAWKCGVHPSGKQKLVFRAPEHHWNYEVQYVPCGKCVTCKLKYSLEWATRISHEMQTCKIGCFITLTIAPEHMVTEGFSRGDEWFPPNSVYKRSLQLFFKRLRKKLAIKRENPETGRLKTYYQKFRYLACGEYGDKKGRPHYHACILGYDFPDKQFWRVSPSGHDTYRSKILESVWTFGHAEIGELTFQSAAYTARYALKKSSDKTAYEQPYGYDPETGEILFDHVNPEFIIMSKGLGLDWWNKYRTDTDKDYVTVDYDKKVPIPRYYDKQRERMDPDSLIAIKAQREQRAKELQETDTAKRKLARNTVKEAQASMLKRSLENGTEKTLRPVRQGD